MRQIQVFDRLLGQLTKDVHVSGVMLMGSVAHGTASPESDLDIMVLGDENAFETGPVEGVLVEYIFTTYERRLEKLRTSDMEVYHFLDSRIAYDRDGKLVELMSIAQEKYANFKTDTNTKKQIARWLLSTKMKLSAAQSANDSKKRNFLLATNSWEIIEAIWAANDKPVPPSGSVMRYMEDLRAVPCSDWFESLFIGNDDSKSSAMMKIIDWALQKLL